MNAQQDNGVIVVGVDGSRGAKDALRFALQEARRRQATLRAVHAWRFGYIGVTGIEGFSPLYGADLGELRHNAEVFSMPPWTRLSPMGTASSWRAWLSRARPRGCWSTNLAAPTCSS